MQRLCNKRIVLGVTGSVAAYKSAELVRHLREAGAEVRVIMTRSAADFVAPLTFQALSGRPVHLHLLDEDSEAAMGHIALARWADVILVAPASADFMARLAQGRADDLLSAVCLASEVPLALAPAMNQGMWQNPATQTNAQTLRKRGVLLFGPAEGEQACGEVGPGRMLEPAQVLERLASLFHTGSLAGRTVLVTAGPTREPIDPVRYLSNRSSGKMGFSIAAAAAEAGARVILVTGPVHLPTPRQVERVDVETAEEMLQAVRAHLGGADILIAAAAVADYRPKTAAHHKIKKRAERFVLELERCPDVLATARREAAGLFCVGFAAETQALESHALAKLEAKQLDVIAANWVGPAAQETGGGFGSEVNSLRVFWRGGTVDLPVASKAKLGRQLVAVVAERYRHRSAGSSPNIVPFGARGGSA